MNVNEFVPILVAALNAVLVVALPALVVVLTGAAYAYLRKTWAEFKEKQPVLAIQLASYARIAVEAAEQAGAAKLIEDKKKYAVEIVSRWLEQVGLQGIDIALIEAEIERQVRKINAGALGKYANGTN